MNLLINATLIAAAFYLVVAFVTYQRPTKPVLNVVSFERPVEPTTVEPEPIPQVEPEIKEPSAVEFENSGSTPEISDRDLITFAKSIKYLGASKWSYSRKIKAEIRAELLNLMLAA